MFHRFPRIAPLALAAAIAMTALQTAAFAGTGETVSRTVSHADLDLATPEGRAMLDRRVEQAVREVCGPTGRDLGATARRAECLTMARAAATAVVDQRVEAARRTASPVAFAPDSRPAIR